jgi:hypothetical protein
MLSEEAKAKTVSVELRIVAAEALDLLRTFLNDVFADHRSHHNFQAILL